MKKRSYVNVEAQRQKYLNLLHEKPWTVDSVLRQAIQTRRSWETGYTTEVLQKVVTAKANKIIRETNQKRAKDKQLCERTELFPSQTIAAAKMRLNRYCVPGLHIAGKKGVASFDGKPVWEFRYWNIASPSDADETREKYEHKMHLQVDYARSLHDHISTIEAQKIPEKALRALREVSR